MRVAAALWVAGTAFVIISAVVLDDGVGRNVAIALVVLAANLAILGAARRLTRDREPGGRIGALLGVASALLALLYLGLGIYRVLGEGYAVFG